MSTICEVCGCPWPENTGIILMPIFKQGASYVCSDECATIARAIEDKGYDSCLAKNGIRVPTLEQIKALPNAPRK